MKLLLPLLCLLISIQLQAQDYIAKKDMDRKSTKLFEEAQQHINRTNWEAAIVNLDKIIAREPKAIDALLIRAGCKYDQGNTAGAEQDYEAVLALSKDYKTITFYRLGVTEFKQEKYGEAIEHFEHFLEVGKVTERLQKKIDYYISEGRVAAELKANPVPFDPISLGPNINTPKKEYLPSFTADGNYLVYTVNYDGQEDFYFSQKDENDAWQKGQPLSNVNTTANEGAQSISADGKTLFFTGCLRKNSLGSCDLYFTTQENGRWTQSIHPQEPLNTRHWESQPSLSANGQWLFFASDRPGGLGGNDIWVSKRLGDKQWGKPINLGAPINTAGNDEAPFIHPDGQTLYFMSDGHPGLGGYDLFVARLVDGQYQEPENLGYPINTSKSEGALVVSLDGRTAYYTRGEDMSQSKKLDLDIYQFDLYEKARPKAATYVKGQILDAQTKRPIKNTNIQLRSETNQQTFSSLATDSKGEFLAVLPAGENYQLMAEKEDYIFHTERFELKGIHSIDQPFELEIDLQKVSTEVAESKETILKNVLFESNSDQLLESSQEELNSLAKFMELHSDIHIQINGHTDNIGQAADNLDLSERRALAVKNYLVKAGIAEQRLSAKGFGESKSIADNDSEAGRALNRRTSFEIIQ